MAGYYCIRSFEIKFGFTPFFTIDTDKILPISDDMVSRDIEDIGNGVVKINISLKRPIAEYTCVDKEVVDRIYNEKYRGKCKNKKKCIENIILFDIKEDDSNGV